jgi:serine protease inhibitor
MKYKVVFFLFLIIALACNKSDGELTSLLPMNIDNLAGFTATMNDFAWNLLATEMEAKPNENVLLSAYSVHTALSMALNGAEDKTFD